MYLWSAAPCGALFVSQSLVVSPSARRYTLAVTIVDTLEVA